MDVRCRHPWVFAFYGDEHFVPTEEYTLEDATVACGAARWVVGLLASFPAEPNAS